MAQDIKNPVPILPPQANSFDGTYDYDGTIDYGNQDAQCGTPTISVGAVTVLPTGIASGEAFGSPTVTLNAVTLLPTGIASAEAFGTAQLDLFIDATGVASDEAFGTAQLDLFVDVTGVTSDEAFGSPTISVGAVTVLPTGITSVEAFGTPQLDLFVDVTGVATAEAFGTPQLDLVIDVTGITTAEALGAPTVDVGAVTVIPTGITSDEAFGSPTVSASAVTLLPTGIASAEAFGTAQLDLFVDVTGVATAEAFGTAQLSSVIDVTGIASAEAFGTPQLDLFIDVTGVTSDEAFGTPSVAYDQTLVATGIASAEAFGTAEVKHVQVLAPTGIASVEDSPMAAAYFDGSTNSEFVATSTTELQTALASNYWTIDFTMACDPQDANRTVLSNRNKTGGFGSDYYGVEVVLTSGGSLQVYISSGSNTSTTLTPSTTLDDGSEHQVSITFDDVAQEVKLYVDGNATAEDTNPWFNGDASNGKSDFYIGHQTLDANWTASQEDSYIGYLSDVRVWDYTRSGAEHAADYLGPIKHGETGLVGHWLLNEQTGSTAADRSGYWYDATKGADAEWSGPLITNGESDETLTITGIAGTEAFGTAVVTTDDHQYIETTGIASGEAFGSTDVIQSKLNEAVISAFDQALYDTLYDKEDYTYTQTSEGIGIYGPFWVALNNAIVAWIQADREETMRDLVNGIYSYIAMDQSYGTGTTLLATHDWTDIFDMNGFVARIKTDGDSYYADYSAPNADNLEADTALVNAAITNEDGEAATLVADMMDVVTDKSFELLFRDTNPIGPITKDTIKTTIFTTYDYSTAYDVINVGGLTTPPGV